MVSDNNNSEIIDLTQNYATDENNNRTEETIIDSSTRRRDEARKNMLSEDIQRIAHGVSLPFYAAIGFTDAVAHKVEDVIFTTRDEWKNTNRSFSQKAADKIQEKREKIQQEYQQWEEDSLDGVPESNIETLVGHVRESVQDLAKGLIIRGRRVSRARSRR